MFYLRTYLKPREIMIDLTMRINHKILFFMDESNILMDVSKEKGQKIIQALLERAVGEGGYSSEAAFARSIGVGPQKVNRWKLGKHKVPAEVVSFALILLSCETPQAMKQLLSKRLEQLELIG